MTNKKTKKAYKMTDENLSCRGFKYEVGKKYTEKRELKHCETGFHSCENPLECFSYYSPATSRFCEVEIPANSTEKNHTFCSKTIKIKSEITLKAFIKASVDFVLSKIEQSSDKTSTTGDSAHAATTGDYAHAATTGDYAHAATTGDYAHAATTGDYAHAATTGDYAHAGTTGYSANATTTGDYANATTTGDYARVATTGNESIAAALGMASKGKCGEKGVLVLAYFDELDRVRVAVGYPGENIKANTEYTVSSEGNFIEVEG